MPTYTIVILNKSNSNKRYQLFQTPPKPDLALGKIWSNVWINTGGTPTPNGRQTIKITEDIFAVCGSSDSGLAQGVTVTETDYAGPVDLAGSTSGSMVSMNIVNDTPEFEPPPYGTTDKANSFAIKVAAYLRSKYPYTTCGMGKYDAAGNVVPILSFTPEGNTTYAITPNVVYYVASGTYTQGTVVDLTTYGGGVSIDFGRAKPGQTIATITHGPDSSWSGPEFSAPRGPGGRRKGDHGLFGPGEPDDKPGEPDDNQ